MAGAAHIAGAALLEGLIGADLVAEMVRRSRLRAHGLAELVVEPFGGEIALFLGDPFLQAEMRRDDEFAHRFLLAATLRAIAARKPGFRYRPGAVISP